MVNGYDWWTWPVLPRRPDMLQVWSYERICYFVQYRGDQQQPPLYRFP